MVTVAGRGDEVKRWREDLGHVSRANMVRYECAWALWDVAQELLTIPQDRWREVRRRMEEVELCGSAGQGPKGRAPTFGDVLRELWLGPLPDLNQWNIEEMNQWTVELLLAQVAAVEAARGADAQWAEFQEYLFWLEFMTRPWQPRRRGRPEWTAFWIAAQEVVNYVCKRHVGFDGKLDGRVSWRRVMVILGALGWTVRYRTTRDFKAAFERWERNQPLAAPGTPPRGFKPKQLGRLTLFVRPPKRTRARKPPAPARGRHVPAR